MRSAANRLLAAIELGLLESALAETPNGFAIAIRIDGVEFVSLSCCKADRPTAKVVSNGEVVALLPGPCLPGSIMICCRTPQRAKRIAEKLDALLEAAYRPVVATREKSVHPTIWGGGVVPHPMIVNLVWCMVRSLCLRCS